MRLRPLVACDDDGFFLRHNDVRVFFHRVASLDQPLLSEVAGCMAEYYANADVRNWARYVSLLDLLRISGREREFASVFDPRWVIAASAHGLALQAIGGQASVAMRGAVCRPIDWRLLEGVSRAVVTLNQLDRSLGGGGMLKRDPAAG